MNSTRYETLEQVEVIADVFIRVVEKEDIDFQVKEELTFGSFDGWKPEEMDTETERIEFEQYT